MSSSSFYWTPLQLLPTVKNPVNPQIFAVLDPETQARQVLVGFGAAASGGKLSNLWLQTAALNSDGTVGSTRTWTVVAQTRVYGSSAIVVAFRGTSFTFPRGVMDIAVDLTATSQPASLADMVRAQTGFIGEALGVDGRPEDLGGLEFLPARGDRGAVDHAALFHL